MAQVLSLLYEVSKRNDDDISETARDLIVKADKWAIEEMGMMAFLE